MSVAAERSAAAVGEAGPLMDRVYRHQRHIYDLTRKYFLLGRDRLIARLDPPPGGTVLELGCGTGRNLIAAARAHPEARFFGIDVSAAMLETARRKVERAGLTARITVARADAAAFDAASLFGQASFDRVFVSYTLSMIPPWERAVEAGLAALREGGVLHVVDFGQQEGLPRLFKALLFAWLGRFHVTPRAAMEGTLAALAGRGRGSLTFTPLYRGYAWSAEIARQPSPPPVTTASRNRHPAAIGRP